MVVVIGGGSAGLGVAWDLLLRQIPVTVVESGPMGRGTSGRFHGLLHSGARYAVVDPISAKQCRAENARLRHIAPSAIEAVEGYFVSVDEVGESYAQEWLNGAAAANIPVEEVSRDRVLEHLPGLTPDVRQSFRVHDAVLEGFKLLEMLTTNIRSRGGTVLQEASVTAVHTVNGRVSGVVVRADGENRVIPCDAVINAGGPWAFQVAQLFQDRLDMQLSSGLMMIYANRMVPHVVNRLAPPGDGDIFVPHGNTVILGTTEVPQNAADPVEPTRREAQYLQSLGAQLFPEIVRWRVLRAFTGVRPLFQGNALAPHSRVSRDFTVVDHGATVGFQGAFSIVGGKWTTFRLMAERTGDAVAAYLRVHVPSTTADVVLTPHETQKRQHTGALVCECETVGVGDLEPRLSEPLADWRTRTWWAMGPCQGTVCAHRGIALRIPHDGVLAALQDLREFRAERERGMRPVAWGDNARQWALNHAVTGQTLAEGAVRKIGD